MIEWLLERFGLVVFALIVIGQVLRAAWRARKAKAEHEVGHDDAAEARRVREIQEKIRRQILERRGQSEAAPPPLAEADMERPIPRPQTTQMPELFGGPLGRMLEELQKKAQARQAPPPPVVTESRHRAEVERQEELAEQLRVVEEMRTTKERRAHHVAEEAQALSQSEGVLRSAARERLLDDLSEPDRLRRAFVLREVLGPPVGLR